MDRPKVRFDALAGEVQTERYTLAGTRQYQRGQITQAALVVYAREGVEVQAIRLTGATPPVRHHHLPVPGDPLPEHPGAEITLAPGPQFGLLGSLTVTDQLRVIAVLTGGQGLGRRPWPGVANRRG